MKTKSSWEYLHDYFNVPLDLRLKNLEDYVTGRIDYNEWIRRDVELWTRALGRRPSRNDILEAIEGISLNEEAFEPIKQLRKHDVIIGILSAGVGQAAEKATRVLRLDFYLANTLAFDRNGVLSSNQKATVPPFQKPLVLTWIARKYRVPLRRVAYVGDSSWDIAVVRIAGCGIAYNCNDELVNHADKTIDSLEELPEILERC